MGGHGAMPEQTINPNNYIGTVIGKLKEIEKKQALMSIENEKLSQDIEGKNRELAISTMSMIKKNQFLSKIKLDLKQIESNQKIFSVIKMIDRNLNNTDDWKFFEEAFNNADKDFLKKVKDHQLTHPIQIRLK